MTIQDLASNPFTTASSPMIGFIPASPASKRELSLRIYRFLIEGIRNEDQANGGRFVERFLEGPQQVWERIERTIRSLPDMWSVTRCEDRFLPHLKWIVGWTSELDDITNDLDVATLRRLIAASVPFWKVRGTEDALVEILRLTTAARVRVLTWFDLRFIAGETWLGEGHEGYDSWIVDLPGGPEFEEQRMNVRIVDNGALNRRLVRNLIALTRPSGERITITYLGFLDQFTTEDDSSQWTENTGTSPPIVTGGVMLLGPLNAVYANPSASSGWRDYVVSVKARGPGIMVHGYRTGDGDSYGVYVDTATSEVLIYVFVAGVPDWIGHVSLSEFEWTLDPELFYTVRVAFLPEGGGQTRITVWLDGNEVLSVDDGTHSQGSIALSGQYSSEPVEISEVEMFFNPLEQDEVDIVREVGHIAG